MPESLEVTSSIDAARQPRVRLKMESASTEMRPADARALGNLLLTAAVEAEADALLAGAMLARGESLHDTQAMIDELRAGRERAAGAHGS